jgi:O-methyltransferase involved in polyketide biosynthesis
LSGEKPKCHLERVPLDLTDDVARLKFLSKINSQCKKILVLTEGVMPYLTNEQAAKLTVDLRLQPNIKYWLLDYYSPEVLKHMRGGKRKRQMKNAPFQFSPSHWYEFFENLNWKVSQRRFLGEESLRLGRRIPLPWWAHILNFILRPKTKDFKKFSGYFLLEPNLLDVSSLKNDKAK